MKVYGPKGLSLLDDLGSAFFQCLCWGIASGLLLGDMSTDSGILKCWNSGLVSKLDHWYGLRSSVSNYGKEGLASVYG